jgi:hypothetical protein
MFTSEPDQSDDYKDACVRRVREDGGSLGAFAAVHGVRERGLLRLIEEQACDETFSRDEASADAVD